MKSDVTEALRLLTQYYTVGGQPMPLNDTQTAVYVELLKDVPGPVLVAAAKKHMLVGKFFPKVSELFDIIGRPEDVDPKVLAEMAWFSFERAIRAAGAYRGAYFLDGSVGETVRQIFGSWVHACSYDTDSPGWAMRKKSFLAIYPTIAAKHQDPAMLSGIHNADPKLAYQVPLLEGAKNGPARLVGRERPEAVEVSRDDAKRLVGAIEDRFKAKEQG